MRTLSKKFLSSMSSLVELSSSKTAKSCHGFAFSVAREVQVSRQWILQIFTLPPVTSQSPRLRKAGKMGQVTPGMRSQNLS